MASRAVAEGIERQADADFLRALTCDIGQGYLFARPKSDLIATLHRAV